MPHLILASGPDAASAGLRALDTWLAGVEQGLADRISLAAGEALGNAVEHGPGTPITLDWTPSAEGGVLCIDDDGALNASHFADPALPTDPAATSGRGLYILAHVADRIEVTDRGLCLSFERRATN